jgi:hypothetical protein
MNAAQPTEGPAGPGGTHVGVTGIILAATALIAAASLLIAAIIILWPAGTGPATIDFLGQRGQLDREHATFLVIIFSGALGGVTHALRSLYWYVGNRDLRRSWLMLYACVPVVGAALALIVYIVVRGGLLSAQASSADVNPYGFSAVAALVGLFSSEATTKLKQIFSTIFAPAEEGRDRVPPA